MGMMKAAQMRMAPMSDSTVMNYTAPRLQRVPRMKLICVGLLAVVALTGCGVGMDDPEGAQAALGASAALMMGEGSMMNDSSDKPTPGQREVVGVVKGDPRVALPQDPIPVYESKVIAPSTVRPPK